jgi:hypothetical protein
MAKTRFQAGEIKHRSKKKIVASNANGSVCNRSVREEKQE